MKPSLRTLHAEEIASTDPIEQDDISLG